LLAQGGEHPGRSQVKLACDGLVGMLRLDSEDSEGLLGKAGPAACDDHVNAATHDSSDHMPLGGSGSGRLGISDSYPVIRASRTWAFFSARVLASNVGWRFGRLPARLRKHSPSTFSVHRARNTSTLASLSLKYSL
jgi:hypothetical protein